jgi:protein-tyrosine phosphatase
MMSGAASFRLVLLCTGNTCRSPLAAAAFREELGPDAERVEVLSAGTAASDGQPASAGANEVAARAGLDLTAHLSRRPDAELLSDADLVLVMEPGHARVAEALGADPRRTHVLSEWPEPGDPALAVSDPFGGSLEAYEECLGRIRRHVRRIVPWIREALRSRPA